MCDETQNNDNDKENKEETGGKTKKKGSLAFLVTNAFLSFFCFETMNKLWVDLLASGLSLLVTQTLSVFVSVFISTMISVVVRFIIKFTLNRINKNEKIRIIKEKFMQKIKQFFSWVRSNIKSLLGTLGALATTGAGIATSFLGEIPAIYVGNGFNLTPILGVVLSIVFGLLIENGVIGKGFESILTYQTRKEQETQAKLEAKAKAEEEATAKAEAKAHAEETARIEQLAKDRIAQEEATAKAEAEAKEKAEAEAKAKAEEEAKIQAKIQELKATSTQTATTTTANTATTANVSNATTATTTSTNATATNTSINANATTNTSINRVL